jgi:membrane protease YdiL (CAAX protease family)
MNDGRAGLVAFFALAFGLSWACWIPAAFAPAGIDSMGARWLTYAGSLGPAAAGITLVYWTCDEQGRRDYWLRVTQWSRIRPRWLLPIFLLYPLVTALASLIERAVTGGNPKVGLAATALSDPLSAVAFSAWVLLLGPLPEELGWRGYALDALQRRWSPLASSIGLGVTWAVWHLPLFFVAGSYQNQLGFGSPAFWSYGLTVVELSVLFTWIHNHNDRSILAAILFHFVLNLTGALVRGSTEADVARTAFLALAAVAVVCVPAPAAWATLRGPNRT